MFEVTLLEMLSSNRLEACRVVGGKLGLDRAVQGALCVREPLLTGDLPVSFLIVTDEKIFTGDPAYFSSFLRNCIRFRCAGVAVISDNLDWLARGIDEADRSNLPLIAIPKGQDMSEWALLAANEIRRALAEKANQVRRAEFQLRNLALTGSGLGPIVKFVAEYVDNPVLITNSDRRLIAASWPKKVSKPKGIASYLQSAVDGSVLVDEVEESINEQLQGADKDLDNDLHRARAYQKTIMVDGQSVGLMRILEVRSIVNRDDIQFVEYASSLAAFELSKDIAVKEERMRLQGDFVIDLVGGRVEPKTFETLAQNAGWDPKPGYAVVVYELSDGGDVRKKSMPEKRSVLFGRLCDVFRLDSQKVLLAIVDDLIVVILSSIFDEPDLDGILTKTKHSTQVLLSPFVVSVGVSEVFSERDGISSRFTEACQALELGSRLYGYGKVNRIADVGLYRFLTRMTEQEMRALISGELGPLGLDNDGAADLKETLLAYFRSDGSVGAAAKLCNLHPSSIKYRLSKIWGGRRPSYDEKIGVYLALLADLLVRKGFSS